LEKICELRAASFGETSLMPNESMKTKNKMSGYIFRSSAAALLFSWVIVALSWAINLPDKPPKLPTPENNLALGANADKSAASVVASAIQSKRTLTFADRVAYQRAIEDVYWRHRIWPQANAEPKPLLDKVISRRQMEKKVEDYLRNSQALEDYSQKPITPDQLQAEMERIASHTKQPAMLREIFAALGNDAFVIAECLSRPLLAERLLTELYANDQRFHGELKRHAEAELQTHRGIGQMKETSGMYTEMEWIKSDSAETSSAPSDMKNDAVKLNGSKSQARIEKLAGEFGNTKGADTWAQLKTGVLSPLREDEGHYYAVAVMKKGKDRLKLAAVAWLKEPLRSWLAKAQIQIPVTMAAASANYTLPVIGSPSGLCTDDTWTPTSLTDVPSPREGHTAVWTGTEMIVWGGYDNISHFGTGGRYDPSTDTWTSTSTANAPDARYRHTAVWTGSEMIVWGGVGNGPFLNSGGRYNPGSNSWTPTSTTNAPDARYFHTAVWTGTEMIIWGGANGTPTYFNTGGRYIPASDSWTATTTTNAPNPRERHTAVWTGSQMIVWGGYDGNFPGLNTGGRYDAGTGSWTATSTTNAPSARIFPTGVWTGSEMIVWGGLGIVYENTGGRYDPGSNSWTATSTIGVPAGRWLHEAVWTASQMIVWGGIGNGIFLDTGGRYNPSNDSWTATSTADAPDGREFFTAVWTGSEMIVWGGVNFNIGYFNTGGRYCAQSGAPTPTPTPTATATATPTVTPTPTPCEGRCNPTPRPRPTPPRRPTL
jgi:N-acetylneuraminic acid mutarotase